LKGRNAILLTTQHKFGHNQTGIETGFLIAFECAITNKIVTQSNVVIYGRLTQGKKGGEVRSIVCP